MRTLRPILVVVLCLTLSFEVSDSQLTFSAQKGLSLPPINLATVYKILKRTWNMFMKPQEEQSQPKAKETPAAQERMGKPVEENETSRSSTNVILAPQEKIIYDQFIEMIDGLCNSTEARCDDLSLRELLVQSNLTLTEQELQFILKLKNAPSLDEITASEFKQKTEENEKQIPDSIFNLALHGKSSANTAELEEKYLLSDDSENRFGEENLPSENKSPSFLPQPFASTGWLATYVVLNSVLLGLYAFLAYPYLVTGRTVDRFVTEEELLALEDGQAGEYLGYTTYGESDMMMQYMLAEENEGEEDIEEETSCMEDMLCQNPSFGGRALTSSNIILKLLNWIPGLNKIGSLFHKNISRMETAVVQGRQNSCTQYMCKRRR